MDLNSVVTHLGHNLSHHLNGNLPIHSIAEVYQYAVLPAGKLFRPLLVWSIANDFAPIHEKKNFLHLPLQSDHAYLASLVEIHHAYTLIHDDLPCMDDDQMRRGRPCTHIQFNEWKALLAGDGLLNISYQLLSKIKSEAMPLIFKIFSWAVGPKGLIQGQVLDLNEEMTNSFSLLKRTHELKTGRLIQFSMIGSYLLLANTKGGTSQYKTARDLGKLGYSMGLVFQLLDDLTEMTDQTLSEHEIKVNPWPRFSEQTYTELMKQMKVIDQLIKCYELESFSHVLGLYYQKISQLITSNKQHLENHLHSFGFDLKKIDPIMKFIASK